VKNEDPKNNIIDLTQLDLFQDKESLVNETKKAIKIFKDSLQSSKSDEVINSSKILKQISGKTSGLGFAFPINVSDGEGIVDDVLDPSDIENWLSTYWLGHIIIFDIKSAEPFNESSKEILNVKEVVDVRTDMDVDYWKNLVCHRDDLHQITENEYRAKVQIKDRFRDLEKESENISHNLFLNDTPALIEVILQIKPDNPITLRSWNEPIDQNKVEVKIEIGSEKYNNKLTFAEAFKEFKTKQYKIESKKYMSIEVFMGDPQTIGVPNSARPTTSFNTSEKIDFIRYGKEIFTHIAVPIFNKSSKFNYKMIPFKPNADLTKKSLYHLTGSVMNQIKFLQDYGGIDDDYIKMLQEDGDAYYDEFDIFKPESGKSMERYFPNIIQNIDGLISQVKNLDDNPYIQSHNLWLRRPVFSGIKPT